MSQMLPGIIESLIILLTAYAGAVIFLFPGDLREGWRWRIGAAGAVFICADVDEERFILEQGVGLGEKLLIADVAEDRAVTPDIVALDRHAAL